MTRSGKFILGENMGSVRNIKHVPTMVVRRLPTTIWELDWLYGVSQDATSVSWGLPEGKMSLWAGPPGVGKSRAAVEVARKVANNPRGYNVLYFQGEMDLTTFAGWVRGTGDDPPGSFFASESTALAEQLSDVRAVKPHLVIVDSLSMISEFNAGSDKSIKLIFKGDSEQQGYDSVCKDIGCGYRPHIIFLSQLTKAGGPRGSAVISHLSDSVFEVVANGPDGFAIRTGSKHRYGRTGDQFTSWWVHTTKGCYCESKFRYEDKLWCQTTGSKYRDLRAECEAERQKMVAEWNKQFEPKAWWRRVLEW
jgi:predicted ATP-dependent serine protease